MERIPVLQLRDTLVVSIQVDVHDRLMTRLQDDLAERIVDTNATGVLIDVSGLMTLDSFVASVLRNIALMGQMLDTRTVLVGIQPAVAITLVEMGVTLDELETALNLERGLEMLERNSDQAGRERAPD